MNSAIEQQNDQQKMSCRNCGTPYMIRPGETITCRAEINKPDGSTAFCFTILGIVGMGPGSKRDFTKSSRVDPEECPRQVVCRCGEKYMLRSGQTVRCNARVPRADGGTGFCGVIVGIAGK